MKISSLNFFYIFLLIVIITFFSHKIVYGEANYVLYKDLLLMDKIHKDRLHEINIDFIKNGFAEYYRSGDREYIIRSLNNKGYKLYTRGPVIDEYWTTGDGRKIHRLARIVSRSRHIFTDLFCLYQQEYRGSIYEYWMLKEWIEGRPYAYMECSFLVTKSLSRKSERRIIYQSKNFFDEYKIDDNFTIVFPEDERYKISAHGFTSCPK